MWKWVRWWCLIYLWWCLFMSVLWSVRSVCVDVWCWKLLEIKYTWLCLCPVLECILWVQLTCHRTAALHFLWSLVFWLTEARIVCYLICLISDTLSDLHPKWVVCAESSRGQNLHLHLILFLIWSAYPSLSALNGAKSVLLCE